MSLPRENETPFVNTAMQSIRQQIGFIGIRNHSVGANLDPNYLAQLNSHILVRDLEMICNLGGLYTLDFIRFDEESMVSVTYPTSFPNRVQEIVLDGVFSRPTD